MTKSTIMVTGATSGIGKATAAQLAQRGAKVIAVGRDPDRADAALAEIRRRVPDAEIALRLVDLADPDSVRALADQVDQVDVLINNAGVITTRKERTPAGLDVMFAANYLGPFLLTNLLLPRLKRVVVVGSGSHKQVRGVPWDDLATGSPSYPLTKTLNILFCFELARRAAGTGVTANVADPGFVHTDLGRNVTGPFRLFLTLVRPFMTTPEKGAATSVYLATAAELDGVTGRCYAKCRPVETSALTRDPEAARRLWELSDKLVMSPEQPL
jgi:NAD(P)-dependent dehydrogenase (short-subunit alcohol dehydrogenase family)